MRRGTAMDMVRRWLERENGVHTPKDITATFTVYFGELIVGILNLEKGTWRFRYSDEFRKRHDLRPITEFPDLDRTYESRELWPFFAMRIPSTQKPAVREIAKREDLDLTDEVQLLKRFGRQSVSNPFLLISES